MSIVTAGYSRLFSSPFNMTEKLYELKFRAHSSIDSV